MVWLAARARARARGLGLHEGWEVKMKKRSSLSVAMCLAALVVSGSFASAGNAKPQSDDWWDVPYPKPFDASKWDLAPSGLLGPVTLTPLRDTTDAAHD